MKKGPVGPFFVFVRSSLVEGEPGKVPRSAWMLALPDVAFARFRSSCVIGSPHPAQALKPERLARTDPTQGQQKRAKNGPFLFKQQRKSLSNRRHQHCLRLRYCSSVHSQVLVKVEVVAVDVVGEIQHEGIGLGASHR